MRAGTPVGLVLGGVVGLLAGVLLGWMPATLGLGVLAGGLLGHFVSPPRDPLARKAVAGADGGRGFPGWFSGSDGGSSNSNCDSGSDGGGCDGGGGD